MNNRKGCAGQTWTPRSGSSACTRRGVIEHGGKFYCRQHDPDAVIARRKASSAYYDLRMEVVHAENALEEARDAVISAAKSMSNGPGTRYASASRVSPAARLRTLICDPIAICVQRRLFLVRRPSTVVRLLVTEVTREDAMRDGLTVFFCAMMLACSNGDGTPSGSGAAAGAGGTGVPLRIHGDCTSDAECPGGGRCVNTSGWDPYCTYSCEAHADCGCGFGTTLQDIADGKCDGLCTDGKCQEVCRDGRSCSRGTCDPGDNLSGDGVSVEYCLIEAM